MNVRRTSSALLSALLFLALLGRAEAAAPTAKTEIKGAAILEHACGKVGVKHMGLVHDGKMAEATKLGTKEMLAQWNALPAADRKMMTEMMKATAKSEAEFSADIKAGGVLVIEGNDATLTVTKEHKDANGTSSETTTEKFKIDGATCLITH